jgi:NAD(P)-dependent dehydrogenase (short-subunit alcohol dehydrogenase family)
VRVIRPGRAIALAGVAGAALLRARRRRREQTFDLRGRTVLITGGSRGFGLALAREFGSRGATLAVCARDEDELARARRDLEARGIRTLTAVADVTSGEDARRAADLVARHLGAVDVLVNNAGIISVGPWQTMEARDYEDAMRTHFWGPLHMTMAVLPEMQRRRRGRIVNVSSIGGKIAVPHLIPYCASKFALAGLSQGLRAELRREGIAITTVYPGLMRTGSARRAIFKGRHRAEYAWFSISASLPVVSMDADRAARQVVDACLRGDAELVISAPAKIAVAAHVRWPELTGALLALVNRLLPGPGGIGRDRAKGADSQSLISPSPLTGLGDRAARSLNQLDLEPRPPSATPSA